MSVQDYIQGSFRTAKTTKSDLNYWPSDNNLSKKIILWKQQPKKTTFLDPVITSEKKKEAGGLGPTKYASQSDWKEDMTNVFKQGIVKKGKFAPHDRPLVTTEFMNEAKRRNIPPPGHYNLPPGDKPRGGIADKTEKSSYHINMAIYQAKQTPTVCYTSLESLTVTKPRVITSKI